MYIGIFTIKANTINSHQIVVIKFDDEGTINGISRKVELFHDVIIRIISNRGSEAVIV